MKYLVQFHPEALEGNRYTLGVDLSEPRVVEVIHAGYLTHIRVQDAEHLQIIHPNAECECQFTPYEITLLMSAE